MKTLLLTGAGGFVGSRILQQLRPRFALTPFPSSVLRCGDETAVLRQVAACRPDYIVHTAAISDTGYSQAHPDESYAANVALPVHLAKAARAVGAKLLAFSSDQVYTGLTHPGPYDEQEPLQPANVYGRHKREAEERMLEICPDSVHLRATWMYDLPGYGLPVRENLLTTLLRAAWEGRERTYATQDYRGVTYVRHVIELLVPALDLPGGVYNFGSENKLNMYETACDFADALCLRLNIRPDGEAPYRSLSMSCAKLKGCGITPDDTQQGIRRCVRDYALNRW